jgi:hypothetical protein
MYHFDLGLSDSDSDSLNLLVEFYRKEKNMPNLKKSDAIRLAIREAAGRMTE